MARPAETPTPESLRGVVPDRHEGASTPGATIAITVAAGSTPPRRWVSISAPAASGGTLPWEGQSVGAGVAEVSSCLPAPGGLPLRPGARPDSLGDQSRNDHDDESGTDNVERGVIEPHHRHARRREPGGPADIWTVRRRQQGPIVCRRSCRRPYPSDRDCASASPTNRRYNCGDRVRCTVELQVRRRRRGVRTSPCLPWRKVFCSSSRDASSTREWRKQHRRTANDRARRASIAEPARCTSSRCGLASVRITPRHFASSRPGNRHSTRTRIHLKRS